MLQSNFAYLEPWFMLAKLNTFALIGIEALPVEVEVDAASGLPRALKHSAVVCRPAAPA
jgi:hypothetical protein